MLAIAINVIQLNKYPARYSFVLLLLLNGVIDGNVALIQR